MRPPRFRLRTLLIAVAVAGGDMGRRAPGSPSSPTIPRPDRPSSGRGVYAPSEVPPRARALADGAGRHDLDVEGTCGQAWVERVGTGL
jgi:hypothetical protein